MVLSLSPASALAKTRIYAIVIAQNRSTDPSIAPLKYADDDGARNWEMFSLFTERASLFAVLDDETAGLHPGAAKIAEIPERSAILARLDEYNRLMAADRANHDDPELFFTYAGHGDIDASGQGYINLHDGRLTRADLYREVIAPSKASYLHVIVDACKSYFLVSSRGSKKWHNDRVPEAQDHSDDNVKAFLAAEDLVNYPRVGVIVATSGDQETHEWTRYRGGILSHELRSALSGSADVNGDGRIEYSELRAFLAAANARVRNPEARLDVFARAPASDLHHPIVDLALAREGISRFLHFSQAVAGRYYLEDERGVRYADFNKEGGASFDLLLDGRRGYYLRRLIDDAGVDDVSDEALIPSKGPRQLSVAGLRWRARTLASRGAIDQSFRQDLYRIPFGRGFYDGFVATSGDLPVEDGKPFVFKSLASENPRHSISAGYLFTSAPLGDAGLSSGADLRYSYRVLRHLDVGVAGQVGYGEGGNTQCQTSGPSIPQQLTRAAFMATVGSEVQPHDRIALRIDGAIGWQLLSGTVRLGAQCLTGVEPHGLRAEVALGMAVRVAAKVWIFGRGGLAIDGAFPSGFSQVVNPGGFFNVGLQLRL